MPCGELTRKRRKPSEYDTKAETKLWIRKLMCVSCKNYCNPGRNPNRYCASCSRFPVRAATILSSRGSCCYESRSTSLELRITTFTGQCATFFTFFHARRSLDSTTCTVSAVSIIPTCRITIVPIEEWSQRKGFIQNRYGVDKSRNCVSLFVKFLVFISFLTWFDWIVLGSVLDAFFNASKWTFRTDHSQHKA